MKEKTILTKEEIQKVLDRVEFGNDEDCWNWKLRTNNVGRPIFSLERWINDEKVTYTLSVQRIMLEYYLGHTVASRYIDVTCGNLGCCNPRHIKGRDLESRLWDNAIASENGCWEWQGATHETGYGIITVESNKTKSTHRLAYELHHGEIPEGLMVLHRCNNRICINPDHLYVGTHNDNMHDMADSNNLKGERNPKAILTEDDVREIKGLIKSRMMTYNNIAVKYGVKRQAIKDIALGRTWAWLD